MYVHLYTMFKLIIFGILLYVLYKLVFEIVVPVSTVATQMKKQVEEMRKQQANAQQQAYTTNHTSAATAQTNAAHQQKTNTASNSDEYIDFEEVK